MRTRKLTRVSGDNPAPKRTRTSSAKAKAEAVVAEIQTGSDDCFKSEPVQEESKPKKMAGSAKTVSQAVDPDIPPDSQSRPEVVTRASRLTMTGYETVIDNLFEFNPDAAYEQVRNGLTLGEDPSRVDYGTLVQALDDAEENARVALQLVAHAANAYAGFKSDIETIQAELHEQATSELMDAFKDPDNKDVTKKPTVADVDAYKRSNYHDEYSDAVAKLSKAKESVGYLSGLSGLAKERCRDLRQMVASSRST